MNRCDVLVIGGGIMGAATAWQAAMRGASVVCLEAGGPTHTEGSSHGSSRIFRQAYWEGEKYLPLLRLADKGWRQLQQSCQENLIVPTGGVFIGRAADAVVKGSLQTAARENIVHRLFDAARIRLAWPQFHVGEDACALHEPGAYAITADASRAQMFNQAVLSGARLCFGEAVVDIDTSQADLQVTTQRGQVWGAGAVVACAGPWMPRLLPELGPWLNPVRMPIFWFAPRADQRDWYSADRFPVFLYELDDGAVLYGLPEWLNGLPVVKIGFHNRQQLESDPQTSAPGMDARRLQEIEAAVARVLPGLEPRAIASRWCFYTMSADESFLIGRSARHKSLLYASACSGHGFKFAPGIGQVLAELATGNEASVSLAAFGSERFA